LQSGVIRIHLVEKILCVHCGNLSSDSYRNCGKKNLTAKKRLNRKERKELAKSAKKEKTLCVHCVNLCDPCGKNFNSENQLNRKERNEIKEIPISSFTESKFFP